MQHDYNYHTHTYRCGHASGTEEEYVLSAIQNGIRYMGFSEHTCVLYQEEEARAFVTEVCRLREAYKDKIELRVGFECEHMPEHFDNMMRAAIAHGAEYLIIGQHCLPGMPIELGRVSNVTEDKDRLHDYVSTLIDGMEKGVYSYIAHPDMIRFAGDPAAYREEMLRLCIAARDHDMPLEINCHGISLDRWYPSDCLFAIAGEVGTPVTIGFDAHESRFAYDGESLPTAYHMIEEHHLNYIGRPKLRLLRDMDLTKYL